MAQLFSTTQGTLHSPIIAMRRQRRRYGSFALTFLAFNSLHSCFDDKVLCLAAKSASSLSESSHKGPKTALLTCNAAAFVPSRRNLGRSCHRSHRELYQPKEGKPRRPFCKLLARPQDNLFSGLSEISIAFSLGVLWSEYSIILTSCGPINFSDALERVCYEGVIASAGAALFLRIITGGVAVADYTEHVFGPLAKSTLIQLRIGELASALAVVGAFVALGLQEYRGTSMDGLSGIDVDMCRAIRDLH